MIEIKGKYNTAKIFTDDIEEAAYKQVLNLMNQKFSEGSSFAIMPDCHAGAGCVIGLTMKIVDKVVPNLVGVDIGCGMLVVKVDKSFNFFWALRLKHSFIITMEYKSRFCKNIILMLAAFSRNNIIRRTGPGAAPLRK